MSCIKNVKIKKAFSATQWTLVMAVGKTRCHTPSMGLTNKTVLPKLDVLTPPILLNTFKTYSVDVQFQKLNAVVRL